MKPTAERVRELLNYDPLTGVFINRTWRGGPMVAGGVAGTMTNNGYVAIMIDGKRHQAHRLAWLYVHGEFPPNYIDHINSVKTDNRIANLRPATKSENNRNCGSKANSLTGWCGVRVDKRGGKYQAQIAVENTQHYLGYYPSPEIAAAVYNHVVGQVHGEFAKPDIPNWLIADITTIKAIGGNMRQIAKCLAAVAIFNAQKEFVNGQ